MTSRRLHWVEYLLEGLGLGIFMISACGFAVLLFHPDSPVPALLPSPLLRGALMGTAMGLTNVVNIYSPWGRRSGAHLNPAVTLTFARLGKVAPRDAVGYIAGQVAGGAAGTGIALALFRARVADPTVNYVATLPTMGVLTAFGAEFLISAGLMLLVLLVSNTPRLARFTGIVAGCLVAVYITFETPLSGMSMNPARTLASAVWAHQYRGLWLYFVAPLGGMLAASQLYLWWRGRERVFCAKFDHDDRYRCIFCEGAR